MWYVLLQAKNNAVTAELTLFPSSCLFSFLFFFFPHLPNCCLVTNCLTYAVAQVNCSSITAVSCFCANQYVSDFSYASSYHILTFSPPPKQDIPSLALLMCRIQLRRKRALSGKPCPAILRDRQRHALFRIYRRPILVITFIRVNNESFVPFQLDSV